MSSGEKKMSADDEKIVDLYWGRDERAIEETDKKYRGYLFSVARNILGNSHDCDECLSDTYFGAWNAIPPERPKVLKAFLTVILRRAAIKRYRLNTKKSKVPSEMTVSLSELEDFVSGDGDACDKFVGERLGHIISGFIRGLSERRRFIFMSRYYISESINEIARELGLSRSMINKELAEIRAQLKEKLESEGYSI